MAALIQTIAIVDKSGKAVSTVSVSVPHQCSTCRLIQSSQSKHLVNVFKEAKSAYRERKAEVVAGRQAHHDEKRVRRALKGYTIEDDRSHTSSRKHEKSSHSSRRPMGDRQRSGGFVRSETSPIHPSSPRHFDQDLYTSASEPREMVRRHSARDGDFMRPHGPPRSMTSPADIDMDLAYGDIPPPLPVTRLDDEAEFKGLVGKAKKLLEEADCLQYSATAIIASLQKNPDAMAAVALTLAEISNIASKMAPGALLAMKGSAPAVFALLASPQFLIAASVGVGITVVALGGYKIIKKIKAKHAEDTGMDEMLEFDGDISRIDSWRRGIAEVEEQSVGTSVDGEFITPQAAALSRVNLQETEGRKPHRKSSSKSKSGSSKDSKASGKSKKEPKAKKPSPLRLMFK